MSNQIHLTETVGFILDAIYLNFNHLSSQQVYLTGIQCKVCRALDMDYKQTPIYQFIYDQISIKCVMETAGTPIIFICWREIKYIK